MRIFLKYIFRCMMEKKGKLVLLILSIAVSTGLFVTISSGIEVVVKTFEKPVKEVNENKDIRILPKDNELFFNLEEMNEEGVKNIEKDIFINGRGDEEEPRYISIYGKEDKYLDKYELLEGSINDFSGNKCVISKRISEEKNLTVGDKLKVFLNGEENEFEIVAITKDNKLFYEDDKKGYSTIIPYSYIAEKLNVTGKYNHVAGENEEDNVDESVNKFNEANEKFEASKMGNNKAQMGQVNSLKSILYVMLGLVVLMSSIIIYGSFKLTITERLSTIGTFLSQGATNGKIEKILLLESMLYGIIGAVFGDLLGIGGQYLINYLESPLKEYGIIEKFNIDFKSCIYGFIFAIILCMLSSMVPILNIRKMQVKDVILNNVSVSMEVGYKKFFLGIVLLIVCMAVHYSDLSLPNGGNIVLIILSSVALVWIYPKIVDIISKFLYKIFRGRSRIVMFSINNIRTSKILMGNITLIIISLLSIFLITSLNQSLMNIMVGIYEEINYDVDVHSFIGVDGIDGDNITNRIVDRLKENEDIDKDSIQTQIINSCVLGDDDYSLALYGVDTDKYKNYLRYLEFDSGKNATVYEELANSTGSNIIISNNVLKDLGCNIFDTIKVKVNGITKDFKVIGSYDGKLFNMGVTAIVKQDVMKEQFDIKESTGIMFNTFKDAALVKKDLKETVLKDFGAKASTKEEDNELDRKSNDRLIGMLSVFSYFAVFIAAIAVLNNIIIGFIQRKRELAILSSVGMGDSQRNRMLLFESVLVVLWAFLFSVPYSIFGVSLISKITGDLGLPMDITLNTSVMPGYMASCLVIIIIASMPILFKNKKLSIIDELKYE